MGSNAILRPHWNIVNSVAIPLVSVTNGVPKPRSIISLSMPILIFLDTLFEKQDKR